MIENFRKYTGVLMFFLALVLIGLVFFGDFSTRGNRGGSGGTYITINGRSYTVHEFQQLGDNGMRLAGSLQMMQFIGVLGYEPEDFFVNRMILRQEAEKFGVYPDDEQVKAYLHERSPFSGPNGEFNQELYNNFVQNRLGTMGMTERDVIDLIRDQLIFEQVSKLVGSGLDANKENIQLSAALSRQQITGSTISLKLSSFTEKLNPSDEEIKTYWEEHKDSYKNPTQRKFSYILVSPNYPAEATAPTQPDPAKPDPAITEKATTAAAARKKTDRALAESVDTFLSELESKKGAESEWINLAKTYGWTIQHTESITSDNIPKELNLTVRNSTGGATISNYLFDQLKPTSEELSKFTEAIPVGEGQWLVARLDNEVPENSKSFEQAREAARADVIKQQGKEALQKAATELQAKIKEQLAAGKSFDDAAKEAGKEVVNVGPFAPNDRLDGGLDSRDLFVAASAVDPGSLTEPVQSEDGTTIFQVTKREVVKLPQQEQQVEMALNSMSMRNYYTAFGAWLGETRAKADVRKKARES